MRCVALGRKNYLFVGSEGGGKAAAIAYTLIECGFQKYRTAITLIPGQPFR
jgi:hypothetical protein